MRISAGKKTFALGMSSDEFFTMAVDYAIIGATLLAMVRDEEQHFLVNVLKVMVPTAGYAAVHWLWSYLDVHKRYGPWKTSEPKSHYNFAMSSLWIVAAFNMGNYASERLLCLHITPFSFDTSFRFTMQQLGPFAALVAPENPSRMQNLFVAVLVFYVTDFWRYWAHRVGHQDPFYRTFPMAHAHHHNQVFVNPLTFIMSPFWLLASWGTYLPCMLFCFFGWSQATTWAWIWTLFPTLTQHLGCDPMPWLTKINHYYCYGALPWIPLYHNYHHMYIVKSGNFGNTTVLFDYLYGTVQQECIYHIEHGEPNDFIKKYFANPDLDKAMEKNYVGARKNRLDLNY